MRVHTVTPGDPDALLASLRSAILEDGPAVVFGDEGPSAVPDGTAVVVTTSGSTGFPKSVLLPATALRASAEATLARLGTGAWLLALPSEYVAGLQVLVRSIVQDRIPCAVRGGFSAESFALAAREMPSDAGRFTSLVPAQLTTLLDADPGVLRSFDAVLVGGQALAPAVRERAEDEGVRVVRTYGSTETCGGCVYDGAPLDGVRARIDAGEILLSGATLASGYLGEPERTAAAFVTDVAGERWYRTGDAGVVADGLLSVTGRIDNVIVSGGVNISLDRVERAVRAVPGLAAAVVVGVPDERWGEASVIAVADDGARLDATALLEAARAAVADEIGAPARPARLVVVDALPMLSSGKPDRERIRRDAR